MRRVLANPHDPYVDNTYIVDEPEELDWDKGGWCNETAGWERVKFETNESGGHDWEFHSDLVDAKYKQSLRF